MLDPLTTAEIQALRLKLQLFASRQSDATVRSQCLAVDTKLAELLEGYLMGIREAADPDADDAADNPPLRNNGIGGKRK